MQICFEERLEDTIFFGSYQKNRTPSANRFLETPFSRFWLEASLESFLLKWKTITMCFEYDAFHNDLNDNVWEQVYS